MENTHQEGMAIGDNIVVTYAGPEQGFAVNFNGQMNYQGAVAMANSILYLTIDAFKQQLQKSIKSEEEYQMHMAIMYDDLNDRFAALLGPITPDVIEESISQEIDEEMDFEDNLINLRFKEMQYDKIIQSGLDVAEVLIKENGELELNK